MSGHWPPSQWTLQSILPLAQTPEQALSELLLSMTASYRPWFGSIPEEYPHLVESHVAPTLGETARMEANRRKVPNIGVGGCQRQSGEERVRVS
jgi:hypothetical protein